MRNGAIPEPQQPVLLTVEDIHRQQRANLALRSLDLEVENIMLQQEIRRLTERLAEFENKSDTSETFIEGYTRMSGAS